MAKQIKTWSDPPLECTLWQEDSGGFRGCVSANDEAVACADVLERYGDDRAARVVSAVADVMRRPAGHWLITEETPFVDVVLVPRSGDTSNDVFRLEECIDLGSDLEVVPVTWEIDRLIRKSCDPPGRQRFDLAIDLRGAPLYAFQRVNAPREPHFTWDSDDRLQLCVALSRFVRPTSISLSYAVRVIGHLTTGLHEIIPGPVRGSGGEAWTATPEHDWLTLDDFRELRVLIAAFLPKPFAIGSRLQHAMWYHEYAARTYVVDVRLPFIATAVEALVTTSSGSPTRHFIKRLPQLAAQLGLQAISNADATEMYSLRSNLIHGAKHGGLGTDDLEFYRRMEDVVRLTLKRAVIDDEFRAIFDTAGAIDAAFPVPERPPLTCPKCGEIVKA